MTFKFTAEQEAWLHDLETTRARQTVGKLRDYEGWCCLGRACKVLDLPSVKNGEIYTFLKNDSTLPSRATRILNLRSGTGKLKVTVEEDLGTLTELNDDLRWSFKKIAKYIRANPENVFTKGAE